MLAKTSVRSRWLPRFAGFAFGAAMLLGMSAFAATALPASPESLLVARQDGSFGDPIAQRDPFTRNAWVVTPNVLGIARHPKRVIFPAIGGAGRLEFLLQTFKPRTGFTLDDEGNIVVDDDPRKVGYFWYGRTGAQHLFVTVHEGNTHAMVYGPGTRFGLTGETAGPVLRELDAAAVDAGGCASDTARATPGNAQSAAPAPPPALVWASGGHDLRAAKPVDGPHASAPKHSARIGLMIYYTNAALDLFTANSDATALQQLQTTATALVDQLNQSLVNSGDLYYLEFAQVGALVNLPGYGESPGITDPNTRFEGGHLLAVRNYEAFGNSPRRETEAADFAILLVADQGNPNAIPPRPVWGAAYTQRNNCTGTGLCDVGDGVYPVPNFSYRNFAYAVVSINPQAQNLTFAHEVGHMLGSNHDGNAQFPQAGLRGAFSFSYGYRVPTVVRDIMADPRCIDTNGDTVLDQCTERQPQFANPRALFIGTAVSSGTTVQNDVARTISCLAEPSGNLYPLGESQSAPNIFWGGFEAPGLSNATCPARLIW